MGRIKIYGILILLFLTTSCSKNIVENRVTGLWLIENAVYDKKNNILSYLSVNTFIFRKSGECSLPTIYQHEESEGKWQLNATLDTITLDALNNVISDKYNFMVYDSNNTLYIMLKSDSLFFKAKKY